MPNGDAPLHIACYPKSISVFKFLLEIRCSTKIPNKKGETAQDIPLNEDGATPLLCISKSFKLLYSKVAYAYYGKHVPTGRR